MIRIRRIGILILVIVAFNSCVEHHIDLNPFILPDLVRSYVRKVECYNEYNTAFIATDGGVLLRYGTDQVVFNAGNYNILTQIQWEDARVLYSNSTQVFWVIEGIYILEMSAERFQIHEDRTEFFQPTKFYFDYGLSPEGKLYRTGFYKEVWDPNSGGFDSDYFIALYEFQGFTNSVWEEFQTDMTIRSNNLASPNLFFTSEGDMILATNPQYRITSYSNDTVLFSAIGKQGQGFDYESMSLPYLSPDDVLYGFDKQPAPFNPISHLYSSDLATNEVFRTEVDGLCSYDDEAQGLIKVLDWEGSTVRFYVQFFTNANSEDKSKLGYIMTYNAASGDCNVITLYSKPS